MKLFCGLLVALSGLSAAAPAPASAQAWPTAKPITIVVPLPPGLPGAMSLQDEPLPATPDPAPRRTAAVDLPPADAQPATSGMKSPRANPGMTVSSLPTTSMSADGSSKPFGHALRLLGDAFAF